METVNCSKIMVLLYQTAWLNTFWDSWFLQNIVTYLTKYAAAQSCNFVKVVAAESSDQTAWQHVSEYHNLTFQCAENFRSLSPLLDAYLMLQSKLHTCVNYLCQPLHGPHQYSWVPWKRNGPLRSIFPPERLHWCPPELAPRVYNIYLWIPCLLLQCVFSHTCL